MCCDEMVLDADGCGDSCGKDFYDPIHRIEFEAEVTGPVADALRSATGDYMFPGLPKPAPVLPAAYITSLMDGRKPGFMEQYLTDRRAALDVPEPPTEPYKWLPDNLDTESAVVDKPFEGFMLGGQVWTPTTLATYMISGAHYSYSLTTRPFKRSDVTDLMVVQACADVKASREYAEKVRSKYDMFVSRDIHSPYEMLRIRYPRIPRKVILAAMRRTEDREFIESGVSIEQAWPTKAGEMFLETEPLRQEIRNLKSQLAVYKKGFK